MELAARDIADGKVRCVDRRKIAPQNLEEDQFKTIVMHLATRRYGVHMPCIIPPFGQVAVRSLILGKAHRWQ